MSRLKEDLSQVIFVAFFDFFSSFFVFFWATGRKWRNGSKTRHVISTFSGSLNRKKRFVWHESRNIWKKKLSLFHGLWWTKKWGSILFLHFRRTTQVWSSWTGWTRVDRRVWFSWSSIHRSVSSCSGYLQQKVEAKTEMEFSWSLKFVPKRERLYKLLFSQVPAVVIMDEMKVRKKTWGP